MRSRNTYGNPFNPLFEGSGGGSNIIKDEFGGGVIYIEATYNVIIDGVVDSSASTNFP